MDTLVLEAKTREERGTGACERLRREGFLPAIVYGQGLEPASIAVPAKILWDALHTHQGANVLVDLRIPGFKHSASVAAMIKEIQRHPVKRGMIHVDFQWVSMTEKVTVKVPVHVEGEAPGVREGGALDQTIHEIEVECLPGAIPDVLIVDISGMEIHDARHVSDLIAPPGVVILHEPTDTVIAIAAPISAAEMESPVAEGELPEEVVEAPAVEEE
jgi:large subunit ribosomal protein L25